MIMIRGVYIQYIFRIESLRLNHTVHESHCEFCSLLMARYLLYMCCIMHVLYVYSLVPIQSTVARIKEGERSLYSEM